MKNTSLSTISISLYPLPFYTWQCYKSSIKWHGHSSTIRFIATNPTQNPIKGYWRKSCENHASSPRCSDSRDSSSGCKVIYYGRDFGKVG